MLIFCEDSRKQMYLHAAGCYPEECCGVLLGRVAGSEEKERFVEMVRPKENHAPEGGQKGAFAISVQDIMQEEMFAGRMGFEIVGVYHSHPDGTADASDADVRYMIPGLSYPVMAVHAGNVTDMKCYEKALTGKSEILTEEPYM